ncbi:MAG: flagellar protein FlgN [Epsilonproteobacteria bacterium]|nr:flagellar protein FlgN [Campylobacterota bacterium]
MLGNYLKNALKELDELIRLTEEDIEDIKAARHESVFARNDAKERHVATFESEKRRIDETIAHMAANQPEKGLEEILNEDVKASLSKLRERLERLKEVNRRFAKLVVAVGGFYNSLYEAMLPVEKEGYGDNKRKVPSLMEVRV